jgi:hypothetical protein
MVFMLLPVCVFAQQESSSSAQSTQAELNHPAMVEKGNSEEQQKTLALDEELDPQKRQALGQPPTTDDSPQQTGDKQGEQTTSESEHQPKRILGIMPNYRAVSAGTIPPPPTAKQAFWIATRNSFDYSAFVFVGLTSLIAKGTDAHPQLGKGPAGYGEYYWRGFLDKTDGNYLVLFALPTVLHQDERYYAMGHKGGVLKRMAYSASRILITPNYEGHQTFNASEVFGRAMAQGISLSYYPSHDRTGGALAVKYGWAILRDAATQMFREFWPDIAVHVLHRHP